MATAMASRHLGNRSATTAFFTGPHERRVVPIAGHFLPRETPEAVVQAVASLASRRKSLDGPIARFSPLLNHFCDCAWCRPGLRDRCRCVRHVGVSAAQRFDLGRVDASMARLAAEDGAP